MSRIIRCLCVLFATSAIALPDNFNIAVYTDETPGARQMAETESGILIVGSLRQRTVYAVVPPSDGEKPEVVLIARNLRNPNGVAMLNGDLYVGAVTHVLRFPNIEETFRDRPSAEIVTSSLPRDGWHGNRAISVGPDGYLYVAIGAPCNVCLRNDERYASILRMSPTDGTASVYAHGVRNSVGMAWHPQTQELWFSDNGRDMMGDDIPHEEINIATEAGQHFGFPFYHAGGTRDPEYTTEQDASEFVAPTIRIQAHAAALGIDFYTHDRFPESYKNALFIAEHGSWNRSSKVGYRVSVARLLDGVRVYEPFVDIWLKGQDVSGRPNDVLVSRNGDLYISDDYGGRVYRVRYEP